MLVRGFKSLFCMFIICSLIMFLMPGYSFGTVIFEDNFDTQTNWQPHTLSNDTSPGGTSIECNTPGQICTPLPPTGWSYYRSTGFWWDSLYKDTIRITNQTGRGGSGKAYIVYNESNPGGSGDGWGADGQLEKLLSQDYPELYIRAWIYYQPGWQWNTGDDMMIKTLRVGHYNGTGNVFLNFTGGSNAPIFFYDFKHSNTWGTRYMTACRCEPKATNYYCNQGGGCDADGYYLPGQGTTPNPTSPGEPADGSWHCFEIHVKLNTYTGGVFNSDGIEEIYYDGQPLVQRTNIRWLGTGSDPNLGWNFVSLGGNAYNQFSAVENKAEQWYAIDDLVVSTSYIGPNYVIGGGSHDPDITPPVDPKGLAYRNNLY